MERQIEHRNHSGSFFAWVLIIFGILWIMKKNGWDIDLPNIGGFFAGIAHFFGSLFQMSAAAIFPALIIFIGILLILGRRFFGALFLVLLILILIPHFLIIPGILMIVFFPVLLIIIGIIILTKIF